MSKTIIIGTRSSKLSLAYANKVKNLILKSKKHEKKIEIKKLGQLVIYLKIKKCQILEEKFFCKEIEDQLNAERLILLYTLLKTWKLLNEENLL